MAYTAQTLITRAYYLSQIVARDLQTVSGSQITDGLDLLNFILEFKAADKRLIPYYQRYSFATVQGQESYLIPNLIAIDAITFNLGDVRFPMQEMSRYDYFGTPRVDNVQSLPFSWREERELGGMRIYMYFVPNEVYTVNLSGKFALTDVTLTTDLSLTYDKFYIEYLRHILAYYICSDYGNTLPDATMVNYKILEKKLLDTSPADLSLKKMSYFDSARGGLTWQQINIGQGWSPS